MSSAYFKSSFAELMEQLVAVKRIIQGYDYTVAAKTLRYFDRFLCQQCCPQQRLSTALLQLYVQHTEPLAPNTRAGRLSMVRVFSRFVNQFDAESAVLHYIPAKRPSLPRFYLYSREEVNALLSAALSLGPANSLRPHCLHMLIGLIWVTGLRISEALGVHLRDLEPDHGRLFVRNGKFGKDRYVALHPSTVARLRLYLDRRQRYARNGPGAALFVNVVGNPLSYERAKSTFRQLVCKLGIGQHEAKSPRLHDLRHTYACNCLEKWRQEGADVNAKLPLLATAMGHTRIESTQVYLHITVQQLRKASERLCNHLNKKTKGN